MMASLARYAAERWVYSKVGWPGERRGARQQAAAPRKRRLGPIGIPNVPFFPHLRRRATEVAAATSTSSATEGNEIGVTGLDVRMGRIYDEYNAALADLSSRMARYEEMRRSDSAFAVIEALLSLPVRAAEWHVEPGDDPELAELIETNIFEGMTHSWDEFLRQALLAPLYGFTVQEKVFQVFPGGYLGWRKFAERSRSTIDEWKFDSTGGLAGVRQIGYAPDTGNEVDETIPIEKLMVWTWRPDKGNPEGLGAYRQAFKAYSFKQAFEEFAAIRIERAAIGIPVAKVIDELDPKQSERTEVLAMMRRFRTGQECGFIQPEGWDISILWPGPADVPFEAHLERQHTAILQTVLGQFVGYAQGGNTGAWSLSKDASSIFLLSAQTIAGWIEYGFNQHCVNQIILANRPGFTGKKPRLRHGKVGIRDFSDIATILQAIKDPNEALPEDIEDFVRGQLGIPDKGNGKMQTSIAAPAG